MADNDVRIKLSLDGAGSVKSGLAGVGDGAGQADSKLKGLVTGGLKGAGVALVGFATAAVSAGGALVAGVIGQYAQYEQNIGGIETMFKGSAGRMEQYAQNAYKTAGLSANEYMSQVTSFSASLLQGLGGDTEKAATIAHMAMVDMSDNANKFGTNISSIQDAYQGFAKQNYTMLDNLKLGYGGTSAEMARLVNDAGLMEDGFVATAQNINDVPFDKIIESINAIQTKMGVSGTTAREAETTISGSIGMLQSSFANLLTGLGSADADVATLAGNVISSFESVVTNITPVIENIGSNIATLGPKIGSMMEGIVGAVSAAIPAVLQAGTALIEGLITGVSSALPGLIAAAVPALVGLVNMIASQLPLLVDAGMKAIIALAQGLVQAIPQLLPAVAQMIVGILDAIISNLPALLEVALQLIVALADGLLAAIPVLIAALPQLIGSLVEFLYGAIPQIITAGIELLMGIIGALPEIISAIVTALPQIITAIVDAMTGAIPMIIEAGIELFLALIEALPQIIVGIVGAIPQIISGLISAILGSIPKLIQAGIQLLMGIIGALPQIISGIVRAIPQIVGGLVRAIGGSVPQLISAGFKLLTGVIGNIGGITSKIVGAVPGIIRGLVSAFNGGVGQMVSIGSNLISGIARGIGNAAGAAVAKAKEVASNIWRGVKSYFGISSPSKLFDVTIGQQLPAGMGRGIDKAEDKAIEPIRDLGANVIKEAERALRPLEVDTNITRSIENVFTPTMVPMTATATPFTGPQGVTITGPLVSVDTMSVRNDQDIRRLSAQLKTDMTRELRAQGVLTA